MSSPVSSLLVGDRLVSRCDDGLLEAEYALFDRSEVLVSPGAGEEGYMTRAGLARARLYEGRVTPDLAFEAFAAMQRRHLRPLARSSAVREIVDHLGPYETFQGGRFVAQRGRYRGVWLDLDALAAECPLRDASTLLQALHLALVLEEVTDDTPVRLMTSARDSASGGRTWRRVDLEPAQRLPWALHKMQALTAWQGSPHDEAEVREEILRDLRARATVVAVGQPRLGMLVAAIARTGSTPPPPRPPIVEAAGEPVEPPPDAIDFQTALQQHRLRAIEPNQPAATVQTALAVRPAPSTPPPDLETFGESGVLDPRLVLLSEPDSQRSASFRLLRDTILAGKGSQIIAVSSGLPHEGKTTCAINLALALSEKPSARVLLVEGNFFSPTLGGIFHIDATTRLDPGKNVPVLAPYCIAQRMRGLDVAALVQRPGQPAPTFNSRWFEMVIGHFAGSDYDHIVIDAAALDGSPVVKQLLGVADGTILTARSRTTTARSLRSAAEQIPQGRALGVILMDGDS